MPLAVCATPIGNLGDVTLRVLESCARPTSCSARTPGTPGSCSIATGSRRGCSPSTSTTRRSGRREVLPRLEAGERVALVSDAGMPGISDPGAAPRPGGARRGAAGDRAARAVRRRDGARRERARGGAVRVRRLPAASARRSSTALWEELRAVAWPVVAFESPRRLPASLALAGGRAAGPRGGGVPGADEAVRGGRARVRRRVGGRALRRAAEGRDHARRRARRAGRGRAEECWPRRGRRWPTSSRRGRPGRRPQRWSRASPASRATTSIARSL